MIYTNTLKPFTASPDKYPQKRFNDKPCRRCNVVFSPQAPSHLYCSSECAKHAKDAQYLKRVYNMSVEDYHVMLKKQDSKCGICGGDGFVMSEHHTMLLVVDHCHTTGAIRGLLCHNCNRGLGLFQDNTTHLSQAIQYLKGATTISKESTHKCVEAPDTPNG